MFKRLKKNSKRGMSIVEYGILIAVIATVASRAYPYLVSHFLGNTQKQVERLPAYSTWQMSENTSATRTQQIVKEVEVPVTFLGIEWWTKEATKTAVLSEARRRNTGFQTGPAGQDIMAGTALKEVDTGLGLNDTPPEDEADPAGEIGGA